VLRKAKANSIFRAHMVRNALKHQPPLSLFGGMATIRSGEHKDRIDMKHSGVVPIVDLGRLYAMIAQTRLEHQAAQIQRGEKPDNFMAPSDLSDFERSHLRDAFVVIKTMQNAAGSSGGGYLN
jgi:CBS domain-containing protein